MTEIVERLAEALRERVVPGGPARYGLRIGGCVSVRSSLDARCDTAT
jgi:hypothetical protein